MSKQRVAEEWAAYERAVLPDHALFKELFPLTHQTLRYLEIKRAFYAGGLATFRLILRNLEPGEEPTPADEERVDEVEEELNAFYQAVLAGNQ